jgi:hypothetical protein
LLPNLNKGIHKGGSKGDGMNAGGAMEDLPFPSDKAKGYWPANESQGESAVQCSSCKKWCRSFKFMKSEKVFSSTVAGGAVDDEQFEWLRTCMPCLSAQEGISLGEAFQIIANARTRWDRERSKVYKELSVSKPFLTILSLQSPHTVLNLLRVPSCFFSHGAAFKVESLGGSTI